MCVRVPTLVHSRALTHVPAWVPVLVPVLSLVLMLPAPPPPVPPTLSSLVMLALFPVPQLLR